MPQMLACRWTTKDGQTQVQPMRNSNGSFAAFGNPFTPTTLIADSTGAARQNLVVQFGGYFYCSAGRDLRIYNPTTGNWDVEVSSYSGSALHDADLFVGVGPTGSPRLCILYKGSSIIAYRTLDTAGGAWSSEVLTGIAAQSGAWPEPGAIKYGNTIYSSMRSVALSLNIATGSFATYLLGTASVTTNSTFSFTRAKNRLFALAMPSLGGSFIDIFELSGGIFVKVLDGSVNQTMPRGGGSNAPLASSSFCSMHYDEPNDSLIVHGWQQTATAGAVNPGGSGWLAVKISIDTLIETDITTTVVPAALRAPAGPNPTSDIRWAIEVDTETDPAAGTWPLPPTYIWHCVNNGQWARYRWNGVNALVTDLGQGGNRGIALSHNPNGGGEYFYDGSSTTNPAYHLEECQARIPLLNGARVFFRGYAIDETSGDTTPATPIDADVGIFYGTTEQTANNLATLTAVAKVSGPGSAPVLNTDGKIANFTLDGITIYSADWDAVTSDFITPQTLHMLMARATF